MAKLGAVLGGILGLSLGALLGSGAAAPVVLPTDYPNLICWIDQSDPATVTEVLGVVSNIADKSGSGNDASQVVVGLRPVLTGAQIGPIDVLVYDTDVLEIPALVSLNYTVFNVINSDDFSSNESAIVGGLTGSLLIRINDTPSNIVQVVNSNQSVKLNGSVNLSTGTSYVITVTSGTVGSEIFINGVSDTSNAVDANYTAGITTFGSSSAGGSRPFHDRMGELVVYSDIKTPTVISDVNGYYGRYGV
ncbi:MAG: hypothetical protein COB09_18895 [Thalassobium sp.]|nr:MAG: hypothetical protein COB09_18895 [Thalassobium sp.]